MFIFFLYFSCLLQLSRAIPTARNTTKIASVDRLTLLSAQELAELTPFAQFSRAAYCPIQLLKDWNCGEACRELLDFEPTLVSGDGDQIQRYFVGYWSHQDTIVVGHEGTDPSYLYPILTDIDILPVPLYEDIFPGVPPDVRVHQGFRNEHAQTAHSILAEVKRLIEKTGCRTVVATGHSLGGALAMLDSVFLTLHLPKNVNVIARVFGTPRVGNTKFALLVDSLVPDLKRVNNKRDLIPIIPLMHMGFSHPKGEIHIVSPENAFYCPGDDNMIDAECTVKSVPLILGNILDHVGLTVPVLLSDFDHITARPIPWSNNGVLSVKNVNHNIQNHRALQE
ncbi:hypothetical protein VKT23_006761 [Stygiomarasmius scandens]|uniref:Fungal lipase-type domain-containing protein n=1 Tax=Marasmiellus scandens TaxID=2682957 RepID=A0ABR1JNB6_9AGAR